MAIITVASAGTGVINAAISTAVGDDTVQCLSAFSATWNSGEQISIPSTKGVTVDFNGSTITQGTGTTTMILIETNASDRTRITNGTFLFSATPGSPAWVRIGNGGSWSSYTNPIPIFDHCTVTCAQAGVTAVMFNINFCWPLIHHCTFTAGGASEMIHNFSGFADDSTGWSQDITPGSASATYIEDCTFTNYDTGATFLGCTAVGNYDGARVVCRYNVLTYCQLESHGYGQRVWSRWGEYYYNTFHVPAGTVNQSNMFQLRGGSGVINNNTTVYDGGSPNNGGLGSCDLIVNLPNITSAARATNVVTLTLQASGQGFLFSVGDSITVAGTSGFATTINGTFTVTTVATQTVAFAQVAANESSATSGTVGTYPLAYQIGRGKSSNVSSPWNKPQALDPYYCWSNTFKTGPYSTTSTYVVDGVDFYSNTPKPGYTPYTYPHPLAGAAPAARGLGFILHPV